MLNSSYVSIHSGQVEFSILRRAFCVSLALITFVVPALAQGIITTVAGVGSHGYSGDGGPAATALLNMEDFSGGLAVDRAGNLYIADTRNQRIRKVDTAGIISTIAGNGRTGFSGDNGLATSASLNSPIGLGIDAAGTLYIVDGGNQRVRRVNTEGIITTVAGNGVAGYSGDAGLAINAALHLNRYTGNCAVDNLGNLFIPDTENHRIRKVGMDGTITTVANIHWPYSVTVDLRGAMYLGGENGVIVKVDASGTQTVVAGGGRITTEVLDVVPALEAWLGVPAGVAVDQAGNIYIADSHNQRIRQVRADGIMITVAGSGQPDYINTEGIVPGGFSGDGGPAQLARLNFPWGVAADNTGNVYIADSINNRIRKVSANITPSANSIDDASFFTRQHYLDFLNRAPDQDGWDYWTSQIAECGSDVRCIHERRIGVSGAFFVELEFQESGYYVYRFYKASFGRQPSFAEFMPDRSQVVGGASLETGKQAFADQWVQRPAFQQAYPNTMRNTEVVNKLFDTAGLIASTYDPQRQEEIQAMNVGRSRALVLRDLIEIPDFRNTPGLTNSSTSQYNSAFVLMQYFGYLRRDVDQGGYDFWLDVLNNREPNNYRGMICSFITSAEYQLRFGSVVTRTNADCNQ